MSLPYEPLKQFYELSQTYNSIANYLLLSVAELPPKITGMLTQ
jgi:hypothetical protein